MFDLSQIDMSQAPIAYCYNDDGIFTHSEAFSIDPLESINAGKPVWLQPAMSLTVPPGDKRKGFVQQVCGSKWQEVEDHRGTEGFVNGQPHEIKACGPLPDGWSATPPPPTAYELIQRLRDERDARLDASDKYLLPDYPVSAEKLEEIKVYRQALRDLPAQPGAPWDGGGELTPWPVIPKL